jgi:hypothetical protein
MGGYWELKDIVYDQNKALGILGFMFTFHICVLCN